MYNTFSQRIMEADKYIFKDKRSELLIIPFAFAKFLYKGAAQLQFVKEIFVGGKSLLPN